MDTVLHDGHGPVVLDLSDVRFMDVSGLRLTVRLAGRAQLHGVDLSLLEGPARRARVRADRHAPLRPAHGPAIGAQELVPAVTLGEP